LRIQNETNKKQKKDKNLLPLLKQKINENPIQFANQLSYYATYKGIPYDVRKAARSICKKHNINFIEWAKKHIEKLNETDGIYFDIR